MTTPHNTQRELLRDWREHYEKCDILDCEQIGEYWLSKIDLIHSEYEEKIKKLERSEEILQVKYCPKILFSRK